MKLARSSTDDPDELEQIRRIKEAALEGAD
jgi:hypothetical protein